jgi:hypothetical protein
MIREIRLAENEELVVKIPKNYVHRELEILVFPISGDEVGLPGTMEPDAMENLKKFRLSMEKTAKSNIRLPKDIDIDDLIDEINDIS